MSVLYVVIRYKNQIWQDNIKVDIFEFYGKSKKIRVNFYQIDGVNIIVTTK